MVDDSISYIYNSGLVTNIFCLVPANWVLFLFFSNSRIVSKNFSPVIVYSVIFFFCNRWLIDKNFCLIIVNLVIVVALLCLAIVFFFGSDCRLSNISCCCNGQFIIKKLLSADSRCCNISKFYNSHLINWNNCQVTVDTVMFLIYERVSSSQIFLQW